MPDTVDEKTIQTWSHPLKLITRLLGEHHINIWGIRVTSTRVDVSKCKTQG